MNENHRKSDIENFEPEDGNYFQRWDLSEPLFDNFFILGPEIFNPYSEPTCLFQYPLRFHKIENSESKSDKNYHFEIDNIGSQTTKFLFPDGIHFIENDENYQIIDSSIADTFSKPPKVFDHIIYIKNEVSVPHYYFCLRFRCSPFSRPAAFGIKEFETLINEIDDIDYDNNYLNNRVKALYLEKMKKYFMNDFVLYESTTVCPSCLFAYCFETHHPFQDLFFKLIKTIVNVESSSRSMAINLHSVINNLASPDRIIQFPVQHNRSKSDFNNKRTNHDLDDDDDFILVNTIPSENIYESKRIVTVKDLSESDSSKSRKSSSCSSSSSTFCLQDIDEKKIFDKKDPNFSWPENSFNSRDNFLNILYNDTTLPAIGEEMVVRINRSSLSKFMWRRPTIEEYCMSIGTFGIDILLEWINLEDFIRLLSLIFLEYDIIVYGKEIELVHLLVSSISHIIFPFSWMFTIMTIISEPMIDYLDSPVPIIAGLYKSENVINKIKKMDIFDKIVMIDIEDDIIIWPKNSPPRIACFEIYYKNLLKFCTKQKNKIDHSNFHESFYDDELKRKDNDVIIISEDLKTKATRLNPFRKNNIFYFDLKHIHDIIAAVFKTNHDVFVSKIIPSIITRVKRDDIDQHGSEAISSMMVDELYLSQFTDQKNDNPFLILFMKTQMFISYREQACRIKSDEEIDSLHLLPNNYTSSQMKNVSVSLSSGFDINNA